MPINYICLDDEAANISDLINLLTSGNNQLSIDAKNPISFDDEVRRLSKEKPDGLLLDLRLDKTPDSGGKRVNYRAISLAQELRTRMTEKKIQSFPIVLWSVDGNFEESYNRDKTGHDLFDFHFSKQKVNGKHESIAEEMVALSIGYQKINTLRSRTIKDIYARLIDLEDEYDVLDARLANEISSQRSYPTHVFADSILNDLIRCSGILIDENHLAARLGVNIELSDDWDKLKSKFSKDCSYSGVFAETWQRWWMFKVLRKWNEICPEATLQRLGAEERVDIIKNRLKLKNLVPIEPIIEGYDNKFWHICYLTKVPISPIESVRLSFSRKEWQDGVYASLKSILEREHKAQEIAIHPFEIDRIKQAMKSSENG